MGLIKTGIKYGAIYGIAREGLKMVNAHQQQTQPQYIPTQQSYYSMHESGANFRDASGYLHHSWCNGQCGHRCNPNEAARDMNETSFNSQQYYPPQGQIKNDNDKTNIQSPPAYSRK